MTARLSALTWDLACPSVTCGDRGSKIIGGNASLRPGKYAPCLLFSSSRDGEGFGRLIPFSPTSFWGWPPLFVFCEEKRIK